VLPSWLGIQSPKLGSGAGINFQLNVHNLLADNDLSAKIEPVVEEIALAFQP
jgi:hypothetical protein